MFSLYGMRFEISQKAQQMGSCAGNDICNRCVHILGGNLLFGITMMDHKLLIQNVQLLSTAIDSHIAMAEQGTISDLREVYNIVDASCQILTNKKKSIGNKLYSSKSIGVHRIYGVKK